MLRVKLRRTSILIIIVLEQFPFYVMRRNKIIITPGKSLVTKKVPNPLIHCFPTLAVSRCVDCKPQIYTANMTIDENSGN